jgi:phosphoesterase RecJ-like protein
MLNSFGCDPEVIDGFINYARGIQGVEVAILLRPGPTGVRVSFRSSGKVNVAKIAEKYGGGGHHNAAGCRMNGELEQVESIIFDTVEHLFLSEPKTSDSSSPAIQAIVE